MTFGGAAHSSHRNLQRPREPCCKFLLPSLVLGLDDLAKQDRVKHKRLMKDLILVAKSERERLKYAAIKLAQSSRREAASNLGVSKTRLRNLERRGND